MLAAGVPPASYATSITYNASGMVHHVDHGTNGGATVRDAYEPDASGLPRPSSISFTGWADCTPPAAPVISAPSTFCVNASAAASVTPVTGATYAWSIGGGTITSGGSTSSITFTASSAGTVTLTVTESVACATQTASKFVTASQPAATVSGSATITAPGSAQIQAALTGAAPWTLTWSDGPTQTVSTSPALRTVSPSVTTTYSVTSVSDTTGCAGVSSGYATITVNTPAPPAPTGVVATTRSADATYDNRYVLVTWNSVGGATSYIVERATSMNGAWSSAWNSAGTCPLCTSWTDGPIAPAALPVTYLYRVRAVNAGGQSSPSAFDYATTASVLFADDPISSPPPGVVIKAAHIVDLRKAVDAVRASAGLGMYTTGWSSYSPPAGAVNANDVLTLRAGLDEAVSRLLGHTVGYSGVAPGTGVVVYGYQLQQIREAVK